MPRQSMDPMGRIGNCRNAISEADPEPYCTRPAAGSNLRSVDTNDATSHDRTQDTEMTILADGSAGRSLRNVDRYWRLAQSLPVCTGASPSAAAGVMRWP